VHGGVVVNPRANATEFAYTRRVPFVGTVQASSTGQSRREVYKLSFRKADRKF